MKSIHALTYSLIATSIFLTGCESKNSEITGSEYVALYEQENALGHDSEALSYLTKAAEAGDAAAKSRLGDAYLHQRYGLNNPELGTTYIQSAAEKGETRAMTNLGILYLNDELVDQNYALAYQWFEKAQAGGDMKAPRYLGIIYENGLGKTQDYVKAASFYKTAADKGDITSQYNLAHLYEVGMGVDQDWDKAIELYEQSAARGDIISMPAMVALGKIYENGSGIEQDTEQALFWYNKAAKLGDKESKEKVGQYQYPASPYIMNVNTLVKVLGDGQKVAGIAIEYTDNITPDSLQLSDFKVDGREITSVYLSHEAKLNQPSSTGSFVIVQLKTEIDPASSQMGGGPQKENSDSKQETEQGPAGGGPKLGQISDKSSDPVILTSNIIQTGEVTLESGLVAKPVNSTLSGNHTLNPDIADFQQLTYHDSEFNKDLMYNLFVPKNYDPKKSYPLVLFMHDAGVVSNNHIETLTQGLGAVIWASDKNQALNESFVLAPQYNAIMADDNSKTSDDMDVTVNLLKDLMTKYSIDANRLYNTGQSMGGMTSIAMDIKYPDLFAASLLVACQWEPSLVTPLANKPLWIVVSQGDNKANPGMDAITQVLAENGSTIAEATWNAEAPEEQLNDNVEQMLKKDATVNYTVFEGGSHRYTWQYAYSIDGIREWLFKQHK